MSPGVLNSFSVARTEDQSLAAISSQLNRFDNLISLSRETLRPASTPPNQPLGNSFVFTTRQVSTPVFWNPASEPVAILRKTITTIQNTETGHKIDLESEHGTGFVSVRILLGDLNIQIEIKDEIHEIDQIRN